MVIQSDPCYMSKNWIVYFDHTWHIWTYPETFSTTDSFLSDLYFQLVFQYTIWNTNNNITLIIKNIPTHLPSSADVRLGLGGAPVTDCRSNDKCSSKSLPHRLFRDRRSNSDLFNEHSSFPVFGKSSDLGIGHSSNCFPHHFNHAATCSFVQSNGSTYRLFEKSHEISCNFYNLTKILK